MPSGREDETLRQRFPDSVQRRADAVGEMLREIDRALTRRDRGLAIFLLEQLYRIIDETGWAMTSDLDIFRSAKILVDQHGLNAIQIAGSKALEMHTSGDVEGEEVWCRIMDAIQELQRTERGSNERQH